MKRVFFIVLIFFILILVLILLTNRSTVSIIASSIGIFCSIIGLLNEKE